MIRKLHRGLGFAESMSMNGAKASEPTLWLSQRRFLPITVAATLQKHAWLPCLLSPKYPCHSDKKMSPRQFRKCCSDTFVIGFQPKSVAATLTKSVAATLSFRVKLVLSLHGSSILDFVFFYSSSQFDHHHHNNNKTTTTSSSSSSSYYHTYHHTQSPSHTPFI